MSTLQVNGNVDGTPKYIQDASSNNSSLAISSDKISIDTENPDGKLQVQCKKNGNGTISSVGLTVTASTSNAFNNVSSGDEIDSGGQVRWVDTVDSDTQLTTTTAFNPALATESWTYSRPMLNLKENTVSEQECFEVQSINGSIMVIPREKTRAAIQSAINYLEALGGVGGTIFLPAGVYTIDSTLFIGDDGQGHTNLGTGIQIIGAGVYKTNLQLTSASTTGIDAIRINGGIGGQPFYTGGVVIKDLQISIAASGVQDGIHTGINNIFGIGIFLENVYVYPGGTTGSPISFKYGIRHAGWGTNLFQFCNINGFTHTGILLTEDSYSSMGTVPNATKIIDCTFGHTAFTTLDHDVYGVHVDAGHASEISGCTFNGALSPNNTNKIIDIYLSGTSCKTVIMNGYFEGADIGIKIARCGNTVMGNWYSIGEEFVQIVPGYEEGNTITGSWNLNTNSAGPTVFHSELADPNVLGSESLNNGDFIDSSNWTTDHVSIAGGVATFQPDGSNCATLIQSTLAVSGVGNRWYKLVYTISNVSGTPGTVVVGPTFACGGKLLRITNGTHVLYFKSPNVPGVFEIWAPPGIYGFGLSVLSLKEIQSGDAVVHGLITGGGTSGIKVLGNGNVGMGILDPLYRLDLASTIPVGLQFTNAGTNLNDGRPMGNYTGSASSVTYTVQIEVLPGSSIAAFGSGGPDYTVVITGSTSGLVDGDIVQISSVGGYYNGEYPVSYVGGQTYAIPITFTVTHTGTWARKNDTFQWDDGGTPVTGVRITGSYIPQALNNGVSFCFGNKFGHTAGSYWNFITGTDYLVDPLQVSDYLGNSLLVVKDDGELDVNGNIKTSGYVDVNGPRIMSGTGNPSGSQPTGSLYIKTNATSSTDRLWIYDGSAWRYFTASA